MSKQDKKETTISTTDSTTSVSNNDNFGQSSSNHSRQSSFNRYAEENK